MNNYYEQYAARYAAADDAMKTAAREHWTRCHMENLKTGRNDLIIFSAQILAAMDIVDARRGLNGPGKENRHGKNLYQGIE